MSHINWWLLAGSIFSGLAVLFGAFGAHGLEGRVTPDRLDTYEIAVRYQMYHGLALLVLGLLKIQFDSSFQMVGFGFILGVLLFSGSLYLLVLTNTSWLGAITPIGGVFLVISWFYLVYLLLQEGIS